MDVSGAREVLGNRDYRLVLIASFAGATGWFLGRDAGLWLVED
jgi:hypothetical protein